MQYVRRGILIFFGITLSGCQSTESPERFIKTIPTKPKSIISKPATNAITKQAAKKAPKPAPQTPVYIDLGPIETVALPTAPTKPLTEKKIFRPAVEQPTVKFGRDISPSATVTAEQLRASSDKASDLLVEQPSEILSDRCDPSYWGGQAPPADRGCHIVTENVEYGDDHPALLPGTYIRLAPKSDLQLENAGQISRKVGVLDTRVSDDALGAVLLLRPGQQGQSQTVPKVEGINENDSLDVPVNIETLLPSVLLSGS